MDAVARWETEYEQLVTGLRAAFDHFDRDGDGRLDADELGAALHALGQQISVSEVRRMIRTVADANAPTIGFGEFLDLVEHDPAGDNPEADLRDAFAAIDADSDGYLTAAELREAAQRTGAFPAHEVARILAAVDTDGDGRISFPEFATWMRRP